MAESDITFGAWLRRRRRALDLTREQLARRADCSVSALRRLEADTLRPSRHLAQILAGVLAIPPEEIEAFIRFARDVAGPTPVAPPHVNSDRIPLATGGVAGPPDSNALLVGRHHEIAQLMALWQRAQGGHCQLALLCGEPGIGKTRLAEALLACAQQQGAEILRGGCYEYEATTPYLPIVEGIRTYVHTHNAATLRAQLGSAAREIARLAPEIEVKLGVFAPTPALPPEDERLRMFDNIVRFLRSLAAERGLVVLLDDLHWVDRSTLVLLHYLLRHLRDSRMLIIAAYREVELESGHPLLDALAEWGRQRTSARITLGRLSQAETADLLDSLLPAERRAAEVTEAIFRETDGNPFFVEEVVKVLLEQAQADGAPLPRAIAIPQSVREAISSRLRHLSHPCMEMLHTAAALGKTFAFAELVAVTTASEEILLSAIDEACEAHIIHAAERDSFTFTHDMIRETLYQQLNPIRQRRLHQRLAVELEQLYLPAREDGAALAHSRSRRDGSHTSNFRRSDVLAYHAVEGRDWQRGLTYSLQAAGNACGVFAHDEALHYYQLAQGCAEALGRLEQKAAIAELSGDVYAVRGPLHLAIQSYACAHDLASTLPYRAALRLKIGQVYVTTGDGRSLPNLTAALDGLDPETQTKEIGAALAALGRLHHLAGRHAQAITFLERASRLVEPLDDWKVCADLYSHLAGACQHLALLTQSIDWAWRCIELAERHRAPQAVGASYDYLAQGSALLGRWDECATYIVKGTEVAEATGDLISLAWLAFDRAWYLHGQGALVEASGAAAEAMARAAELGESRLEAWAGGMAVLIQADLGHETGAELAERIVAQADQLGHPALRSNSRRSLGYLYLQRQEWQRATELLDEAASILAETDHRGQHLWLLGACRAEAYLALDRSADAAACIAEYLNLARESLSRCFEGLALRVQAQVFARQQDYAGAVRDSDASIALLEETSTRLELGRALYHRALLERAEGHAPAARLLLERARGLMAGCGAARDLQRVEAALTVLPRSEAQSPLVVRTPA